ncbi:MAG: hypothetical protein A3C46_04790 [Deltaproteobacteria bacterium RIFCSPHIGHO2_02_FULL_44_16]|nr:MAG: hypothetical protein A3C46_04790 [Deltaproteobacteria bacterium RIFCSPHIGHO2_02_FULL_44_16]
MPRKSRKTFYITTAIDYVNSIPHIGTAYEKIGADVLARWHRLCGDEVHFQMGNDEHSINVQRAAEKAALTPKQYCDQMRVKFEGVWKKLNISYDGFIQTSEKHHEQGVQKLFQKIFENGDIYKKPYEGWYCESCEAFYTEKDIVDGMCPNHKTKPKWLKEENYFFKLSNYTKPLLKHIENHPEFVQPEMRRNEILSLLREGLEDISVSRSTFDWGIQLPNDPKHVVYVWFDALINYITAVGYGSEETEKKRSFKKWWPQDGQVKSEQPYVMHVIGKDITRFHCVIWPAMLMSAEIELPQNVFGHGFVSFKGEKMSKSLGNVVTPLDVIDKYGADPLRYYLLREGSFGHDSDFTWENFINRYNGDLANGLGNLVSRTIGMVIKFQNGKVSLPDSIRKDEQQFHQTIGNLPMRAQAQIDSDNLANKGDIQFHIALQMIWYAMSETDKYINDQKPWVLAKEGKTTEVNIVLYHVLDSLRMITPLLFPFMPTTAEKIWSALGFAEQESIQQAFTNKPNYEWGQFQRTLVKNEAALFPRIEDETAAKSLSSAAVQTIISTDQLDRARDGQADRRDNTKANTEMKGPQMELIDITDFAKIDLRVAEILTAEKIEGADRLLKLRVSFGNEERQIVAGIAQYYQPTDLIGKKIVIVANLKPAKLRGIESQGMLLAASDDQTVSILTPFKEVTVGSKVK